MDHLTKAFVLFSFGFAILAGLGDALDKKGGAAGVSQAAESPSSDEGRDDSPQTPTLGSSYAGLAEKPLSEPVRPSITKAPVSTDGTYAQVCASFDPIAHPEQVIDILEYASATTGTPVDVLYAVWQKETGFLHGDGRLSGGCDLKSELARRDAAAGTRHWSAMLAMADALGWKQRYGENLERMTCSCPAIIKETGLPNGFGGCCGPFQFSGDEVAHRYAIPLKLDPMRFCDGALIAGWELKAHSDNAFKPDSSWGKSGRGGAILAGNPGYTREQAGWQAAMSRYYGGDTGGIYGRTAVAKWKQFHAWYEQDKSQPGFLVAKILGLGNTQYSLRKLRAERVTYASK